MAKKVIKKQENPKEVWIELSDSSKVRISVSEFKGVNRLDIRKWVKTPKYEGFTKDGVSVVTEKAEEVYRALEVILNTIKQDNLFNAEADGGEVAEA
jgi:hypothetical protein